MKDSAASSRGHVHGEAFCLMWYACGKCKHRERIWNSRDGVTPFGTRCPSCGEANLTHVDWQLDEYAPEHKPPKGQRFWRDGTPDEAEAIMGRRIQRMRKSEPVSVGKEAQLRKWARSGEAEFQPGWPMLDTATDGADG